MSIRDSLVLGAMLVSVVHSSGAEAALTKGTYPTAKQAALKGAASSFSRVLRVSVRTWGVRLKLVGKSASTQRYLATSNGINKTQIVRKQRDGRWKAELGGAVKGDQMRALEFWEHQ